MPAILLYLVFVVLIAGVVWWLTTQLPLPAPLPVLVQAVIVIIFLFVMYQMLQGIPSGGLVVFR